jgi:hypothetical protein
MEHPCRAIADCGIRACRASIRTVPISGSSSNATTTMHTPPCCDSRDQSVSMRSWRYSLRSSLATTRHLRSCGCLNLVRICFTHEIARRAFLAFALFVVTALPAAVAAGSAHAQLVVGVTVVRSCVINAQPASPTSSLLTLSCAAGAMHGIQLNQSSATFAERSNSAEIVAPTTPISQGTSQSDLRVLTLNF